jgi:hypothetical protein
MGKLSSIGKKLTKTPTTGMGKTGAVLAASYIGYKGLKGLYDATAKPTIKNAMDVAFGDPNADQAVLGTDLTPSMMYGASGLPGSVIGRTINPTRFPVNPGGRAALIGAPIVGAAAGAALGNMASKVFGGKHRGILVGAGAVAGAIGGIGATATSVKAVAQQNSQIISQSPYYNQSALTAQRLNASGEIVLGMHNGRRGM